MSKNKGQSISLQIFRLWAYVTPKRRHQFATLLLVMVLTSFAEMVSLGSVLPFLGVLTAPQKLFQSRLFGPVIQYLGIERPDELLLPITIFFVAAILLSSGMRIITLFLQTRLSHAIGADLGVDAYRRTLYQPYLIHASRNSSEIIGVISIKINRIVQEIVLPSLMLISSVFMLASIISLLVIVNAYVAIIASFAIAVIYAPIIFFTRKRLLIEGQKVNYQQTKIIKVLQEGLGGIRDVIIDRAQAVYCHSFTNADAPLRISQTKIQILSNCPRFMVEGLAMLLLAFSAYLMVRKGGDIIGILPLLGVLAVGAQRLLPVVQQTHYCWTSLQGAKSTLDEVLEYLNQELPKLPQISNKLSLPFSKSIVIKDLDFRYSNDAPLVLKGVECEIKHGERVGIIGTTGSGKSTLLDIVMGLLPCTSGRIEIDGHELSQENRHLWMAHIAHVPQTVFLADTTIAENIAFGIPIGQIDFSRVKVAAERACIDRLIESWDQKYNTSVGERGIRLSGGQRQRIGIARALYKNTDVIVFDEATSALDGDTESEVMAAIEGLAIKMTVIIVAHRLTTLKNCTKIIELRAGEIQKIGSYAEVITEAVKH